MSVLGNNCDTLLCLPDPGSPSRVAELLGSSKCAHGPVGFLSWRVGVTIMLR